MVGARAAGVDVFDLWVGFRGLEGCEAAEDTFGHWRAADVAEADEEDGDLARLVCGGHCLIAAR